MARYLLTLIALATRTLDAQTPQWQLAAEPAMHIETYKDIPLGTIAGAATVGPRVVVADASNDKVFVFDSTGRPLSDFGSRGRGPGEFTLMVWLGECTPGTVSVLDPANARVTRVSLDGHLVGTSINSDVFGTPTPYEAYCHRTGTTVVVGRPKDYMQLSGRKPGPHRSTVTVSLRTSDGSTVTLGEYGGPERFFWAAGGRASDGPRPFGKRVVVAVSDRIFVGTGDSLAVDVFGLDGKRLGVIRYDAQTRTLTAAGRERFLSEAAVKREQPRATVDRILGIALPDEIPAYERFIANGSDVWVQVGHEPTDTGYRWLGFNRDGKMFGVITVPNDFQLYEISDRTVLGKWTDEDQVESVRRYRLVRSTPQGRTR